ncbi:hypothetical protein SAMN02745121_06835 [Nannocystis exedens]|uniref:Uncharacterized protein n=1 Tax=Nannocystis exedens TaxID=54 RepID=A0A1I2FUD7_9BACT|nr:hypothetical protein [Nannocystis exedens]PCC73717.1 hypothetical protein NAEX_06805 [Nannocystis exedens]SFF08573.1 hypothetical protein SAMN02745121_06835 [Nannocystis exedens]
MSPLPLRVRILGGLLCAEALSLTVYWVATGTGPYAVFRPCPGCC